MNKVFILITLFLNNSFVKGQVFPDSLYLHLYNYQIIKGELKSDLNLEKLSAIFNVEELIDNTNTKDFSIYKFYHLEYEEPLTSFIIIEQSSIEIYDLLSYSTLIEKVLDASINDKLKGIWIKEILRNLRSFYEVVDMTKLIMQKDYGKYHYYIPISNIKNNEGIIK